jgi:hypothetical protein
MELVYRESDGKNVTHISYPLIGTVYLIYFVGNRTRNEHFAYQKQAAKSNFVAIHFNSAANCVQIVFFVTTVLGCLSPDSQDSLPNLKSRIQFLPNT